MSRGKNVNYYNDSEQRENKKDWMFSVVRQPEIKPVAANLKFWALKDKQRYYREFNKFANDLANGVYGDVEDADTLGYLIVFNQEFYGNKVYDDFINVLPEPQFSDSPTIKGRGRSGGVTVFGVNKQGLREPVKVLNFKLNGKTQTRYYGLESNRFVKMPNDMKQLKEQRGF